MSLPEFHRVLNTMGYFSYQKGLVYRHLNQSGGWDQHLEKCREYILKAVELYAPRKITVLGSGWLLDVPLAELSEKADNIVLIDIVHPPVVKEQVRKFKNVMLVEADLTGGLIGNVFEKVRKKPFLKKIKSIMDIEIPSPELQDPGMVISLNILTQLDVLPVEFLRRHSSVDGGEIINFRAKVQKAHIDFLMNHQSVLITDFEEVTFDRAGNGQNVPTLFTVLPEGRMTEEWTWDFDLKRSDFYNTRSVMHVKALITGK